MKYLDLKLKCREMIQMSKLEELSLEITQKCNNHCIFCYSESHRNCNNELSFDKIKEIIDDAVKLGVKRINLSGGEPFLHPNIYEIMNYIKSKTKAKLHIYTSGNCEIDSYISADVITFDIPSIMRIIYDRMCDCEWNVIHKVLDNLQYLSNIKKHVEVITILTQLNFSDLAPSFSILFRKYGVKKINVIKLVKQGRAYDNWDILNVTTKDVTEWLKVAKQHYGDKIVIGTGFGIGCLHGCQIDCRKLSVRYDGLVFPCEYFKNNKLSEIDGIKPDSIWDKRLFDIYYKSEYLSRIKKIRLENKTEHCIGESLMN
jgi:MoaA/NifB/PqqE/SkfB family radical SAM enzyme